MAEETGPALTIEIQHLPIMVVENNPALLEAITTTLTGAGVKQCSPVRNGLEAWNQWERDPSVGVIIASWSLPGLGGFDLMQRIRAEKEAKSQPAFIFMARDETHEDMARAVKAGADGFLIKPFPPEKVVPTVVDGVEHRKQVAGQETFTSIVLKGHRLLVPVTAELLFDRYSAQVECDELSSTSCVIRSDNNYGLGTLLRLRLSRRGGKDAGFYQPFKGTVIKMERLANEFGMFRVHIQISGRVRDHHGIKELLLRGDIDPSVE